MGPVGPGPRSSTEAADADATAPMGSMGRVALPRRVLVVVVWGRSGNPKGGLPKENINIYNKKKLGVKETKCPLEM